MQVEADIRAFSRLGMNTSQHCSLRTFWLGYCDWFRTRAQMSHKEVWEETRRENSSIGRKLLLFPLLVITALVLFALSSQTVVRHTVAAGATSKHVAIASEWGTIVVMSALAGYFIVSKSLKIVRFCQEMCERGRMIEAKRENTRPKA